jgi:PAB-dependent poly(A)-specific ribonuclease subunit 3
MIPMHSGDPFPSLPAARMGFAPYNQNVVSSDYHDPMFYDPQSQSIPSPPPPSPPRIAPSMSEELVIPIGATSSSQIAPEMSPRSFHDQMRQFTGIGAEPYRSSFGLPEDRGLHWELQCMRERVLATTSRDPNALIRLPEIVQHKYHSLLLLDNKPLPEQSSVLGYKTAVYKAMSITDAFVYALRRVDGFRLSNFDLVQDAIERWSEIKHPNIVAVRQAFATSEFQDVEGVGEGGSLVYVYDYIDLAQTLHHWRHHTTDGAAASRHLTVLWDVIVQVSLALRLIHSRGLAARCIHPSKILVSSRFRIHINCVGLIDAIHHSAITHQTSSMADMQAQDLMDLGKIIIAMATGLDFSELFPGPAAPTREALRELVASSTGHLPRSIQEVLDCLISGESSAESIIAMSGSYIAFKAEQLESAQDILMSELRKGVDITRLQRMLVKISAITDRPHLLDDWRWASTGDRYIVQLFRDYIFFQVDDTARPFFDVGHVTDCLAKVDIGSFEPIMLMNRDGSTVLITNFNDVRRCIDSSFKEIADASAQRPGGGVPPPPPHIIR